MSSVRLELRNKPNKAGEKPIALRITIDRKKKYKHTGIYIKETLWNKNTQEAKKQHPNCDTVNRLLNKILSDAREKVLDLRRTNPRAGVSTIREQELKENNNMSFFELADHYLDNLSRSNKYNQLSADKPRVKHLKEFFGESNIDWNQINELNLREFRSWLKATRNVSERTIANHLVVVRTICNLGIRQGFMSRDKYPFGRGKLVIKFPESNKIGLTQSEIKTLESIDEISKAQRHALNIWLFSFYTAGMRVSDVLRLKWKSIENERLYYQMNKNGKTLSLKLPDKAICILKQYGNLNGSHYIFPELNNYHDSSESVIQKEIKNAVKKFNTHLKNIALEVGLSKPLTMHIARHTFGNISSDKIPINILQKLYRHSSIVTTSGYQNNFIQEQMDNELNKIVSN